MEFYISPDQREAVERKINLMFKHVEHKPKVTFGVVEQIVKHTTYDLGYDGYEHRKEKINAIHVEIEDIAAGDWTLVASVDYLQGILTICDSKRFKEIPQQYGLNYMKCDHCGAVHRSRKESHILYNTKTGEWMQVGSTCVNKMINGGKYLNGLMLKLWNVVKMFGGCDEEEWFGGGWRPSKKYLFEGIPVKDAFECCLAYMEENGEVWQKAEWEQGRKVVDSTNDHLICWFKDNHAKRKQDDKLFNAVKDYYMAMERGEDGEYNGPSLTQKIIDAFNNDFIALCELYVAWFSISNYKKHLLTADFAELVKSKGVEKGMKLDICGKLEAQNYISFADEDGYYFGIGQSYAFETVFEDQNTGLIFKKNVSEKYVIEPFLCEDGLYRFNADVKYIALKGCYVGLGGRLRKQKKVKYVTNKD